MRLRGRRRTRRGQVRRLAGLRPFLPRDGAEGPRVLRVVRSAAGASEWADDRSRSDVGPIERVGLALHGREDDPSAFGRAGAFSRNVLPSRRVSRGGVGGAAASAPRGGAPGERERSRVYRIRRISLGEKPHGPGDLSGQRRNRGPGERRGENQRSAAPRREAAARPAGAKDLDLEPAVDDRVADGATGSRLPGQAESGERARQGPPAPRASAPRRAGPRGTPTVRRGNRRGAGSRRTRPPRSTTAAASATRTARGASGAGDRTRASRLRGPRSASRAGSARSRDAVACRVAWPRSISAAVTSRRGDRRQARRDVARARRRGGDACPRRPDSAKSRDTTRVTFASAAGARTPKASDATAAAV